MLPSGRILCYGNTKNPEEDSPGWFTFDPRDVIHDTDGELWIEVKPTPSPSSYFKAHPDYYRSMGHTLTADGRYLSVGGDKGATKVLDWSRPDATGWTGLADVLTYEETFKNGRWTGGRWIQLPDMQGVGGSGSPLAGRRFYPTVTRLPDGTILAAGGLDLRDICGFEACELHDTKNHPNVTLWTPNRSVERYDPTPPAKSGPLTPRYWTTLSKQKQSPTEMGNDPTMTLKKFVFDYTSVFVLPEPRFGAQIMMISQFAQPVFFDYKGKWWSGGRTSDLPVDARPAWPLPGSVPGKRPPLPNHGASPMMLPIRLKNNEWGYHNGSVIVAGGTRGSAWEDAVDVFDPVDSKWKYHRDLKTKSTTGRRTHCWAVVLPTGQVVVLGGGYKDVKHAKSDVAQLIDPRRKFKQTEGTETIEVRSYHAVAMLLRDGSVLFASGQNSTANAGGSGERTDFRYYYPPYYDDIFRPNILEPNKPATLEVGKKMTIQVTSRWPISEAVLIALPSVTHSINMNDRHVQVKIEPSQTTMVTGTLAIFGNDDGTSRTGGGAIEASSDLHGSPNTGVPGTFLDIPASTRSYTITAPSSAQVAPPGHYMLFVLDSRGFPSSLAKVVKLEASGSFSAFGTAQLYGG